MRPAATALFERLAHRRLGAEAGPPMHQLDGGGDAAQGQRPIDRRVAAAGDHHPLAAEGLPSRHRIVHTHALVSFDAREGRPIRPKQAAARGDDHRLGADSRPGGGRQHETLGGASR